MNQHDKTIEKLRKLGFKKGSIIEASYSKELYLITSDEIRWHEHGDWSYCSVKTDSMLNSGRHYIYSYEGPTVILNIDDIAPIKTKSIDGKHFYHDRNDPSNGYGIAIYDKKLKPIKKKQ